MKAILFLLIKKIYIVRQMETFYLMSQSILGKCSLGLFGVRLCELNPA